MFGGAEMIHGNVQGNDQKRLRDTLEELSNLTRQACPEFGIGIGQNPFAKPSNFLAVLNPNEIHLVVDDLAIGGIPNHTYMDRRHESPILPLDAVIGAAVREFGFKEPMGVTLPFSSITDDQSGRRTSLKPFAQMICQEIKKRLLIQRIQVPRGYEHFSRYLPNFLNDHPNFEKNVFLMMRFRTGQQYQEIHSAIKDEMAKYGLKILRADDKDYTGDLWENVCLYMLGCTFGIAVFEEIDLREFNPNVALELGFMTAQNKRCLLLKDQRMPRLPTDIVGKLYKEFDTYQIQTTIQASIKKWCNDVGISRVVP